MSKIITILCLLSYVILSITQTNGNDRFAEARKEMVEEQIEDGGIENEKVLNAMLKVSRHKYVLEKYIKKAYDDRPLPIGYGQTISQPYVVGLMTELLELEGTEKVLEIGTGSGYQAAVLAEIVKEVYTIEIIEKLAERAKKVHEKEGYKNITSKVADGYYGWKEFAPFDAIIVTAAPDHIPQTLVRQLKDGGRMTIPVGPPGAYQTLWQIKKRGEKLDMNNVTTVRFVPLTRDKE